MIMVELNHNYFTNKILSCNNREIFFFYQFGATVNVADLWKFTPLHEAAAKGKYEICRLLLKVSTAVLQYIRHMKMKMSENRQECVIILCDNSVVKYILFIWKVCYVITLITVID